MRISGVPVGKVVKLELGPGQTTEATIQLDERYAPIPRDSRAILRSKTLLGETFVELTPGRKQTAGLLPEDGILSDAQVSKTVELDEIFRSLDPRTAQSLRGVDAVARAGDRGPRRTTSTPPSATSRRSRRTRTSCSCSSTAQEQAVQQLIRNTGIVFNALSAPQRPADAA